MTQILSSQMYLQLNQACGSKLSISYDPGFYCSLFSVVRVEGFLLSTSSSAVYECMMYPEPVCLISARFFELQPDFPLNNLRCDLFLLMKSCVNGGL